MIPYTNNVNEKSTFKVFRDILIGVNMGFLMEAHDGLSAKIVQKAGFKAIWGSGLSISTALGLRDTNEASWSDVIDVVSRIHESSGLPVLLDGDTGYGNFNNVRQMVKRLCREQIAAVCIEDKVFPKNNSFLDKGQELADINEFCGKICAAKDAQTNNDFSVITRVEALIAGRGMREAIRRAEAYRRAGADAILIHSKKSNADEIIYFMKEWTNRLPVIIVPTKYHTTPVDIFRKFGVNLVIWANQNLRASLRAMENVSRLIFKEQSISSMEEKIATVEEIFSLLNYKELEIAEIKYLPSYANKKEGCVYDNCNH